MKERNHLEDPDVDVRLMLRLNFWMLDVVGMKWIKVAQDKDILKGNCEFNNETSDSIIEQNFMNNTQLVSF
jgi:hypothetical protein